MGLSIGALRRLNSREWFNHYERQRGFGLEEFVIESLMTVRELERMDAEEELYCRMTVEGWTQTAIARELGCSNRKVQRLAASMARKMYDFAAADYMGVSGASS